MAHIKLDYNRPLKDGISVSFKAPCDCANVDGLCVYYDKGGRLATKVFTFRDTHGNDLTRLGNLFSEGACIRALLDIVNGYAYLENADTNAYLEGQFGGKQNKLAWATDEDIDAMFDGTYEGEEDEDPEGGGYLPQEITDAVTYTPQVPTEHQKSQARKNIGVTADFYSTEREEIDVSHEDMNSDYIYGLYDALMEEYPSNVTKKIYHNNDGTFTNYGYVISTGDYPLGLYNEIDDRIKKPKYLILSGIHGNERKTVLSTYRFVRDVLKGYNVPNSFREGVILCVMPVGNPNGFNAFVRENAPAVYNDAGILVSKGTDINRNFDYDWVRATTKATDVNGYYYKDTDGNYSYIPTAGAYASSEKETQAITNWLSENFDAKLYIDFHNNGAVHEIALVLGLPNSATSDALRKIALKGLANITPYWRDVIGYPPTFYSTDGTYDNGNKNGVVEDDEWTKKYMNTIFAYSATVVRGGLGIAFAQEVVGIPSIALETSSYYGDFPEWNAHKEEYPAESIAMGAEALGNILLEYHNQTVFTSVPKPGTPVYGGEVQIKTTPSTPIQFYNGEVK